MSIMLGNLSTLEIQDRLGITFPQDLIDFMNETNQAEASNIQKGKWHCFDIPFNLVCGDVDTAKKVFSSLKDQAALCKEPLRISVYEVSK